MALLLIIIFAIGVLTFSKYSSNKTTLKLPGEGSLDEETKTQNPQISTDSGGYKTVWIIVRDTNKLFLNSNLDNKSNSNDLATKNSCVHLISGGFYDTKGNHIGLLISEGETISESQDNKLFNGYFSVSKTGVISITEYPVFSPRISLQSGPYLLKNSEKVKLSLEKDENARRIVVGVTKNQLVLFLVIYDQKNTFSGPKLAESSEIIEKVNKEAKLNMTNVINLDGGAHSAFITDLTKLSEASPIGSYFCIRP